MDRVKFCQRMMMERIAPPDMGGVTDRIQHASRVLRWTKSRTRAVWYADYRIRINPDEMDQIEKVSGVRYARNEVAAVRSAIARADALIDHEDENIRRAFDAAFRTFLRVMAGTGVEGGSR